MVMDADNIRVGSFNELRKYSNHKTLFILTAFKFYVRITKTDLRYSLGKHKYSFVIDIRNTAVFIKDVKFYTR